MRILFVLGGLRIGGYEILSVKIANELARENEVAIISLSDDSQIIERVSSDVETHFVTRNFKLDFSLISRITKILNGYDPEILFSCAFFPYFVCRFSSSLLPKHPKFVLAFHVTKPFNLKEDRWNHIFTQFARLFNDSYIAVHTSQIDFYSERYGLPRRRFVLIHNGVDTSYFKPGTNDGDRNDNILRIAHVASLKPLKDQMTLLKSMVELNKSYNSWELRIAGADQSSITNHYREYVKEHNISSQVKFLGAVGDTHDILKDSDVFILTSITEALPLSVIEAMAMGLPCILTDVGGNSDIVDHGQEGYLVNVGDYTAVAEHLEFLGKNPEIRKEMGIAARKKAETQFDFKTMVDKYVSLFESLVNK